TPLSNTEVVIGELLDATDAADSRATTLQLAEDIAHQFGVDELELCWRTIPDSDRATTDLVKSRPTESHGATLAPGGGTADARRSADARAVGAS
ncbi:MAG: hypothetical protein KJ792_16445, partial [Actinobacteria bacterium]|nr:hypothetical protein [Actinomycetota bacterium]